MLVPPNVEFPSALDYRNSEDLEMLVRESCCHYWHSFHGQFCLADFRKRNHRDHRLLEVTVVRSDRDPANLCLSSIVRPT